MLFGLKAHSQPAYAEQLSGSHPRPSDKGHLDDVFVKINGRLRCLWRAVNQHGAVLDVRTVTPRRGSGQAGFPDVTQGLAVCAARAGDRHGRHRRRASTQIAHRELTSSVEHRRLR